MITRINPPELGSPPGYSQIVEVTAGRIIFIAGQTALDRDGNLVGSNDFAAQAEQVFNNLSIALQASGHGRQSGEAHGVSHRHGQSRPLPRGT
jgi:enamine deaminase RidA (YjgF/YER057c/UK114 family)